MSVILTPEAAAEAVCHKEQMEVWASDLIGMLSLGGYLRENIDYSEGIDLAEDVKRELRSIIVMAFSHPEAKTIKVARP
jgi:hypothetical protein